MSGALYAAVSGAYSNGPLALVVSPSSTLKTRVGAGDVTTDVITATASGGQPPYTYSWTYVSGDVFTINTPSASTTTFTGTLGPAETQAGSYQCTVTDSLSATASDGVDVTLESSA